MYTDLPLVTSTGTTSRTVALVVPGVAPSLALAMMVIAIADAFLNISIRGV
jgi:hypothetical protein